MADQASLKHPLILHVIDELCVGGAETHLCTMLQESLRAYPYRHHVISLFGDGPVGDRIRALGVPLQTFNFSQAVTRRHYFGVVRALQRVIREIKPDLVEATLSWSRLLALPAAKLAGVPKRFAFEQGDIFLNSWKWRAINFAFQPFFQKAIVCSEALKKRCTDQHGFLDQKLLVLHNCVDTRSFGILKEPHLAKQDLFEHADEKWTVFGAVGTLGNGVNKRMDVLIRAVSILKAQGAKAALVICGDGTQRPVLEKLSEELGVSKEVRFLGTRNDVDQVLAACDVFCHAAPFEPFGIVCIEAMWMGLPAVVPDSGGIVEIVRDGIDGFIYPALNAEAAAEKMGLLIADPSLRQAMSVKARHAVEERFSAEVYMKKLYQIYGLGS